MLVEIVTSVTMVMVVVKVNVEVYNFVVVVDGG